MDLLPKSSEEFQHESYWNSFFTQIKDDSFEWYGEYDELASLLHKYVSSKDNVLITGCGNSTLSHHLYQAGVRNQTNIDISDIVVQQMRALHPEMIFLQEDVTTMENFQDESFSCVLDKGTFDALTPPGDHYKKKEHTDGTNVEKSKGYLMLEQVSRVIKKGGRFICISLLQPHVAQQLFSFFESVGWMIRVCRCLAVEEKATLLSPDGVTFPIFMNIFTKVCLPPTIKPVIEASFEGGMMRLKDKDDLLSFIVNQQSLMNLRRELVNIGAGADREIMMRLVSKSGEDRFLFYVTDAMKLKKNPIDNKFGVFIVPQGRECEWLFGTHDGRIELAIQSNFTRLVVVHFVRGQIYESMEKVQDEITPHIKFMMPKSVAEKNIRAPIMTISNDPGIRTIRFNGKSSFSGDFVVEDVLCDGGQYSRRLIFLNNPNVIQSDVGIKMVKKRGKEAIIFKQSLACEHHQIMCIAFSMLQKLFKSNPNDTIDTLLIGVGGGLLASFLVNFVKNIKLTAVEIDEAIVKVAEDYFGLPKQIDRFNVVVDDGLKFLDNSASQYNVILIDVDSKSISEGLSCPPPEFLEEKMLLLMKSRLKPEAGILVLNLVCRNPTLKKKYIDFVANLFPMVYSCQLDSDLNNLLFCFASLPIGTTKVWNNSLKTSIEWLSDLMHSCEKSNASGQHGNKDKNNDDNKSIDFDILDRFKLLKVEK